MYQWLLSHLLKPIAMARPGDPDPTSTRSLPGLHLPHDGLDDGPPDFLADTAPAAFDARELKQFDDDRDGG